MFDPVRICSILNEEHVDYVVATRLDGPFLANASQVLNLVTDSGDVDLTFRPSGPLDGYAGWNANAALVEIAEAVTIRVAALDDGIDSKRAAHRPKDQMALPYLESLREQIDRTARGD